MENRQKPETRHYLPNVWTTVHEWENRFPKNRRRRNTTNPDIDIIDDRGGSNGFIIVLAMNIIILTRECFRHFSGRM